MTSWFEDPKQLVRVDKVHEFWPSKTQSSAERVLMHQHVLSFMQRV